MRNESALKIFYSVKLYTFISIAKISFHCELNTIVAIDYTIKLKRARHFIFRARRTNHCSSHTFLQMEEAFFCWRLVNHGEMGSLFQSILRVETNSANLVDSIISSRLENSPPSSSVFAIRSIPSFTYRRRNCECRRACNCESSKENGNFLPKSEEKNCRQRALTGSKLSIEISIT